MSEVKISELGWLRASGTPREIGLALGRKGRKAVHDTLVGNDYWKAVTGHSHAKIVDRMARYTRDRFPDIWEEISGLAEGLELPFAQVMAWNSRGDLVSNVPDGCTTVQIPGAEPVIAHNEDGLPAFRGHAFIAELSPDNAPGFVAFCYPGSIPGHTFAVTQTGLAQAVNNLRLTDVTPDIPRMVLGRAVLNCACVDAALELLRLENNCGGFHFTLAQAGESRLTSIEFGGGACAYREVAAPAVHANHSLFLDKSGREQIITDSSADRQARGTALIGGAVNDPLVILRDTGGTGLPIHRTAQDDPDCENTLATAVMFVQNSGVEWRIYDQNSKHPVFTSEQRDG